MAEPSIEPESFPPAADGIAAKRRAVFSRSVRRIDSQHAKSTGSVRLDHSRRRRTEDDSLRLIDDLTNRPMDPLFSDSRLVRHPTSALTLWATRLIVFVICIAVGFFGCLFVQRLHSDPRKAVRQSWASELRSLVSEADGLSAEVGDLQDQVTSQSQKLNKTTQGDILTQDGMSNGSTAVTGEGITLTLANPIAADDSGDGTYHRDGSSQQIRVVTDSDMQMLVSLLWQSGAEAIAINGYRLGVQTSIRTAGQTIMIGTNPVQSPYRIEAIGDRDTLAEAVGSERQKSLYASFEEAGIYPQVSKSKSLTLEAATAGTLSYARKDE